MEIIFTQCLVDIPTEAVVVDEIYIDELLSGKPALTINTNHRKSFEFHFLPVDGHRACELDIFPLKSSHRRHFVFIGIPLSWKSTIYIYYLENDTSVIVSAHYKNVNPHDIYADYRHKASSRFHIMEINKFAKLK
jgi:hypothetical protein